MSSRARNSYLQWKNEKVSMEVAVDMTNSWKRTSEIKDDHDKKIYLVHI